MYELIKENAVPVIVCILQIFLSQKKYFRFYDQSWFSFRLKKNNATARNRAKRTDVRKGVLILRVILIYSTR